MASNPPAALGDTYGPLQTGPLADYGALRETMVDLFPLVLGADGGTGAANSRITSLRLMGDIEEN